MNGVLSGATARVAGATVGHPQRLRDVGLVRSGLDDGGGRLVAHRRLRPSARALTARRAPEAAASPPSTAVSSPTVELRSTSPTLSVVHGTASTKQLAYVTGHIGGWNTNRTLTLTAQPAGGTQVVLASGPVDIAGKLTATCTPQDDHDLRREVRR